MFIICRWLKIPYKSEYTHKKIPRRLDKRVKISLEDREEIKRQYKNSSQRKLPEAWGVSRRLIQFILDPDKKKRDLQLRKLRGGSKSYYDREKQVKAAQKTRIRRKELDKNNLLEY